MYPQKIACVWAICILIISQIGLYGLHVGFAEARESPPSVPQPLVSALDVGPAMTSTTDATVLANTILGPGIGIVGSPVLVGVTDQQGTFTGGAASVGFDTGIILTSGNVTQIPGTNNGFAEILGSASVDPADDISTDLNTTGDPDLDVQIAPIPTHDANSLVITFQFGDGTVGGDVKFNYRACGEEYINFADGTQPYNDPFALLIDGENVAKLPDGTTTVSINNINPNVNSAYYENNVENVEGLQGRHLDFHWDGCTIILTAEKLGLGPGPHTLKLAVADASDHILDYGVFIQAGSVAVPDPCDGLDNNGNGIVDEGTVGLDDNKNGLVDEQGDGCPVVGGKILGIDATSLFIAGIFGNTFWIIPIVGAAAAGIVGFVIRKRIS